MPNTEAVHELWDACNPQTMGKREYLELMAAAYDNAYSEGGDQELIVFLTSCNSNKVLTLNAASGPFIMSAIASLIGRIPEELRNDMVAVIMEEVNGTTEPTSVADMLTDIMNKAKS